MRARVSPRGKQACCEPQRVQFFIGTFTHQGGEFEKDASACGIVFNYYSNADCATVCSIGQSACRTSPLRLPAANPRPAGCLARSTLARRHAVRQEAAHKPISASRRVRATTVDVLRALLQRRISHRFTGQIRQCELADRISTLVARTASRKCLSTRRGQGGSASLLSSRGAVALLPLPTLPTTPRGSLCE